MGFRPDINKILTALQPTAATRQTLLFSATMPADVVQVAQIATRGGTSPTPTPTLAPTATLTVAATGTLT